MTIKSRIAKLEKQRPTMTNDELTERVKRVLEQPALVPPLAYHRIVELLNLARARKERHEQFTATVSKT